MNPPHNELSIVNMGNKKEPIKLTRKNTLIENHDSTTVTPKTMQKQWLQNKTPTERVHRKLEQIIILY